MQQPGYIAPNTGLGTLVALNAASAGTNSADLVNGVNRGVTLFINVSVMTGTSPTLTVTIEGKDPVSGQYYTILESAALDAVGFSTLTVYPGVAVTANQTASAPLPQNWRVTTAVAGTTPAVTATVSGCLQA
ncbi:MAG: hypothetical protein ACYDBH_01085 [Acidobacteriaceae bacterium]